MVGLFATLITKALWSSTLEDLPASQPIAKQVPPAVICLAARADPTGEGIAGYESEEDVCAYYFNTPSDDEGGATAESLVDDVLLDLESLFQE